MALRVNLDETAVCLFYGDVKGNVFESKGRPREFPGQRVPRWKRRCYVTFVALICDRVDVQPLLPQFIVCNTSTLKASAVAALQAACPSNVTLVRQKSAWNNEALLVQIIEQLGRVLAPFFVDAQPILLMDAARIHTTRRVLSACARASLWLVVVPAKLTWLLQPLDTDVFFGFKACLRKYYQSFRVEAAGGDVGLQDLLACTYAAIRDVLQKRAWALAFERCGFGKRQDCLSAAILKQLEVDAVELPATKPSNDLVKLCFPKRAKVDYSLLWSHCVATPTAPASGGASSRSDASARGSFGVVRREPRTRAEHRRAASFAALPNR